MPLSSYIYGRAQHRVTSPLIIVEAPNEQGQMTFHHLYAGNVLPPGVPDADVARWVADGAVTEIEVTA